MEIFARFPTTSGQLDSLGTGAPCNIHVDDTETVKKDIYVKTGRPELYSPGRALVVQT